MRTLDTLIVAPHRSGRKELAMGLVARQMYARYRALQAEAKSAMEHFKKRADFPAAQVRVLDGIENLKRAAPEQSKMYQTPERLKFVLDLLDIRAGGYLPLVADMESQEAYMKLVAAFRLRAIEEYTGFSTAEVLFSGQSDAELAMADKERHWTTEGYRRLASLEPNESRAPVRRGYRAEVNAWMVKEGISTIPEASKALGISETTLKSIMSDKGQVRYGADTLASILRKIQIKG